MVNIAETRVPIRLDRERFMMFNANGWCAFEKETGKFFFEVLTRLFRVMRSSRDGSVSGPDILKHLSMVELTALIWSSIHEYDDHDNPVWPLSINTVRRYLTITQLPQIFKLFLEGAAQNQPTTEEMGESQAPPRNPEGIAPKPKANEADGGGETFIELPAAAFV